MNPDADPQPDSENPDPTPRRRRRGRWRLWAAGTLLAILVTGELVARFALGLGDPPLLQMDPEIEYLFKPNQDCRRFGQRIRYNAYSMRSDDFPAKKSRSDELRVLVVGDSVVNGGSQTDQAELATTLIRDRLASTTGRPVVVGNASAGSWGPPNELAYLRRYGLFDADVLVLVVSSHDSGDAPRFEPSVGVRADFPDRRPVLALWEGVERYVLPRFRPVPPEPAPPTEAEVGQSLDAVRQIVGAGRAAGARVIVALHQTQKELAAGTPEPGHDLLRGAAAGAEVVELGPAFQRAAASGTNPYRDDIHPSAEGQRVIADVLTGVVLEELKRTGTKRAGAATLKIRAPAEGGLPPK